MYNRYKDLSPQETTLKIKKFLTNNNLKYEEVFYANPYENIHSMSVSIPSLGIQANGKGTTKEYCIASGYAELIERLLNLFFKSYTMAFYKNKNMVFYKDSKLLTTKEIFKNIPVDVLRDFCDSAYICDNKHISLEELIDLWKSRFGRDINEVVSYYDVINNKCVYLPIHHISAVYGSTGLSFGNSFYEAVNQAIFEIFERYAISEIIMKELSPPEISMDYIKTNHKYIFDIISKIHNDGLSVCFYDCSLYNKIPVVCCIITDKSNGICRTCFGSHISMNIAMERCLTEIFQGYTHLDSTNLVSLNVLNYDKSKNIFHSIWNNSGKLPIKFFCSEKSWEFIEWKSCEHLSNKEINTVLISLLDKHEQNIYIRAIKCSAGYAVRVYIPQLNSFTRPCGLKTKVTSDEMLILHGYFIERNLTNEEIQDFIRLSNDTRIIDSFLLKKELLLASSLHDIGDIQGCINNLSVIETDSIYYKIIKQFIELYSLYHSINEVLLILNKFYKEDDIFNALNLIKGSFLKNVLDNRSFVDKNNEYFNTIENNIIEFVEYFKNNFSKDTLSYNEYKEYF